MAARYLVAAATGYLLFLLLVRLWIAAQRGRWTPDVEVPGDLDGAADAAAPDFAGGAGSFGGGGASGSYEAPDTASIVGTDNPPSVGFDFVPDVDDAWPLLLAVAALLAGIIAIVFVVYASPILFAEVLLDAAVVGAVYRRARLNDRGRLHGVLRRTWLPATALCLSVALAGGILQVAAPEAKSLGAAIRAFHD
jgi:hypothetical protein